MREILGKRRSLLARIRARQSPRGPHLSAALACVDRYQWPVLPGAEVRPDGGCGCPRGADCPVPGAHPDDPELLAATTDPRMVRWWWAARPQAALLLATGGRAPGALSLPVEAGTRALPELSRRGVEVGPVTATVTRMGLLIAPYDLSELGELLHARDRVPSSLRFHGAGGYLPLPPSRLGGGKVRWVRPPIRRQGRIVLPRAAELLDVLIEAGISEPDPGSRLAY